MNAIFPMIIGAGLTTACLAQTPHPEVTVDWSQIENRVAWHGSLEKGLAAAKSSGRPILLISGAPHCQLIPGVW